MKDMCFISFIDFFWPNMTSLFINFHKHEECGYCYFESTSFPPKTHPTSSVLSFKVGSCLSPWEQALLLLSMESQNLKSLSKEMPTKNNEPCNMKGLKENGGLVNE